MSREWDAPIVGWRAAWHGRPWRLACCLLLLGWLVVWEGCLPTYPKIACQPCPCGESKRFRCHLPDKVCMEVQELRPPSVVCGTVPTDGAKFEPPRPREGTPDASSDSPRPDHRPPLERTPPPDRPNPPDVVPDFPPIPAAKGTRKRCLCPGVPGKNRCTGTLTTCTLSGAPIYSETAPQVVSAIADVTRDNKGNLYVTDVGIHAIWKVGPATGGRQISILAGGPEPGDVDAVGRNARFHQPVGIDISPDSKTLYVVDNANLKIKAIDLATKAVTTIAGSGSEGAQDGNASSATFREPIDLAVDASGNVYVSDTGNHRIRKIDIANKTVSTWVGRDPGMQDGQGQSASFSGPLGLTFASDGHLYVIDNANNRIRKVSPTGIVSTFSGSTRGNGGTTRRDATFSNLADIAVDAAGNVYVTNRGNHSIRKIATNDAVTTVAGGSLGFADGKLKDALFRSPLGMAVSPGGTLFVVGPSNRRLRQIIQGPTGEVSTILGIGPPAYQEGPGERVLLGAPRGLAPDDKGALYVADERNNCIRKIDRTTGQSQMLAGCTQGQRGHGYANGSAAQARFYAPRGIAFSNDVIFVADTGNHTIRQITPAGEVRTIAGLGPNKYGSDDGKLSEATWRSPSDIVAATPTTLYVSDAGNHKIRLINLDNQMVTTIAGSGSKGFRDGNGAAALFSTPEGMVLSADKAKLYVVDRDNHSVREVGLLPPYKVTTLAGNGNAGFANGDGLTEARFHTPVGIALAGDSLYIADTRNGCIRKLSLRTRQVTTIGLKRGSGGYLDGRGNDFQFFSPVGMTVDATGKFLFVSDRDNYAIRRVTLP